MFTKETTQGYTDAQLDALNNELAERLELERQNNPDFDYMMADEIEKEFYDEVARR